jgi:hypothetical protein
MNIRCRSTSISSRASGIAESRGTAASIQSRRGIHRGAQSPANHAARRRDGVAARQTATRGRPCRKSKVDHDQRYRHFGTLSRVHRRIDGGSSGKCRWPGTPWSARKGSRCRQELQRVRIFWQSKPHSKIGKQCKTSVARTGPRITSLASGVAILTRRADQGRDCGAAEIQRLKLLRAGLT